jgi:hypothetical protein
VTRSVFARTALSAGSSSCRISARASSAPSASHHICATQSGCEWSSAAPAGVASSTAARMLGASRVARRITALAKPAKRPFADRASSTVSETAAWTGTESRNSTWASPSRSASRSGGSSSAGGRLEISSST